MESRFPIPQQQDLFYREALNGLRDPVAVLDDAGRLLYANTALEKTIECQDLRCARDPADGGACGTCLLCAARESVGDRRTAVAHGGRVYELTVSAMRGAGPARSLAVWHDVTVGEEAARLLRDQYGKMRRDIFHARSVQSSLLPKKLIQVDGYFFDCLYKPCEEMSGDIFDLVRIGRDTVAFYVADVAGHGVTAAMLTVFFSTAIRLEMHHMDMPGEVLSRIHRRFVELDLEEQRYITAFLVKLELSTGKIWWSNAGHICPPVLVGRSGPPRELEMAGLPISRWFADQAYHTGTGQLAPEESLLLFSDGLEARWHDLPHHGSLAQALGKVMQANPTQGTLEAIWRRVGAEQKNYESRDDTTLLQVTRMGSRVDGGR